MDRWNPHDLEQRFAFLHCQGGKVALLNLVSASAKSSLSVVMKVAQYQQNKPVLDP